MNAYDLCQRHVVTVRRFEELSVVLAKATETRPSPLASHGSETATHAASAAKPTLAANQSQRLASAPPAILAGGPCLGSSGGADIGLLGRWRILEGVLRGVFRAPAEELPGPGHMLGKRRLDAQRPAGDRVRQVDRPRMEVELAADLAAELRPPAVAAVLLPAAAVLALRRLRRGNWLT